MSQELGPNLDVQRLMHQIRANVASQQRPAEVQNGAAPGQSNGHFEHRNHYHVNDLLRFHGEDFVRQAYRALLRREPDDSGMAHHLEQLASGRFNKMDVLASLHSSPEGRSSEVTLSGLTLPVIVRRLGRIPLVGYLVRVAVGIGRLPRLVQHQNQFEFYTWSQHRNIIERQDQHYKELSDSLQQISAQILEMMQRATEQQQANELTLQQYETLIAKYHVFESMIAERLAEIRKGGDDSSRKLVEQAQQLINQQQHLARIDQTITQQNAETQQLVSDVNRELREELETLMLQQEKIVTQQKQTDTGLLMQERGLAVLLDQIKNNNAVPNLTAVAANEQDHLLDTLYASFEDQFRGSREEISRRLQVYLPFLKEAEITGDVLDIGCGRGEWLQLLRSEGIEARGVDRNRVFVESCRSAGLNVVEQDALSYLRSQPDNSLSAISAIHFVEHVPFETLIAVVDEVRRILKPGGLLIAETPNPENFMVGSCNFYADPTHRNPIPSETLKFLLESRGLRCKEVLKLRPWDEAKLDGDTELISRFNEYFYSAPDYGIVATKP
jgi:O-antigen chain-terminating methyltransferase